MKRLALLVVTVTLGALVWGCSSGAKFHKTPLPDPKSFNAHFGDMDADGNALVNWKEFDAFFKNAEPKVFKALDLNKDDNVDHDEWHQFKEAHGLKHKE